MSTIKKFLVIILAIAMVFSTASFAWAEDGVTYSDAAQENVVDDADVNEDIDADADVEPEADVPEPAEEEQPVVEEAEEPANEAVDLVESEPVISNEDEAAEKGLLSDSGEEFNNEETDKSIIDYGSCGSNITYVLYDDGEMIISGSGDMFDWSGTNGVPWYNLSYSIKTVIINDGVTKIGRYAFNGCSNLTSISIPDSVTSIGDTAFSNCISLKSITIPNGVTKIGNGAFYNCNSLVSIAIPDGVTSIYRNAFENCTSLEKITLPESVTSIWGEAFLNCSSLESIMIPEGVTNIEYSAFSNCGNLINIYIVKDSYSDTWFCSNGYQSSIKYVFKSGEHYYYEDIVNEAGCETSGVKIITCIICGEEYTEEIEALGHNIIKVEAKEPTELKEGNIEYWVCDRCGTCYADENGDQEITAESVVIPKLEPEYTEISWSIEDGILIVSGEGWMEDFETASNSPWYSQRANITKIVVSDGLTHIGNRAFYQCSNVTEVEIASSIESIGEWAFNGNTSLVEVNIPASVIVLSNSSFRACPSLEKVTFEGDAPSIGTFVFNGASENLTIHCYENTSGWDGEEWSGLNVSVDHKFSEVTIIKEPTCTEQGESQAVCLICGETITETLPALGHDYIDGYCTRCRDREIVANGNCGESNSTYTMGSNVRYVLYGDGELVISGSGKMHGWESTSSRRAPWYGLPVKSIVIESGVKDIGSYAFSNCNNLTSITIPESVTSIGDWAFSNCSSLTSITIPESVTSIGYGAFSNCSRLTSITIPFIGGSKSENRFIGYIFGASSYTENSIAVPTSLKEVVIINSTDIPSDAFYGCSSLTSITIPESVTSIGYEAFSNCSSLTSITIPESVTSIGNSTFRGCSSLTSITIPESVTSIGEYAFRGCGSLTSITIPESVTSIGVYALSYCYKLANIYTINGSYADTWCSSNGYNDKIKNVYKLGHHYYYETIAQPSCTQPGIKTAICVICGDTISENIDIDPDAHNWGEWSVSIAPDCIHEGEETRACLNDSNHVETRSISATGIHNYVEGYCTVCGDRQIIETGNFGTKNYILYGDGELLISGTGILHYSNLPKNKDLIKVVTIESGITELSETFYNCNNLKSVTLPSSITVIGSEAFYGCSSLSDIIIPESVTTIDGSAFSGCSSMTNITIPKNVDYIGESAFNGCTSLTNIIIPEKVVEVSYNAFKGCSNLTSITITGKDTYLKSGSLSGCDKLKAIYILKGSYFDINQAKNYSGYVKYVYKSGDHYIYETVKKRATLTANGTLGRKCTVCGKVLSDKTVYYPKTIKLSATSYTYDGKVKKPTVTVKDSKGNTISKTNYTVTYASGRKNVGSYKVTIKFKGNYSGTKTLTFKINPKGTTLKTLTATSKGFKATWTKQATKMSTSYITGYEIQYSTSSTFASGNKTVVATKYSTVSKTISKLKAKKKYYVRIRTYKIVNSEYYFSPWSAKMYVTTKA